MSDGSDYSRNITRRKPVVGEAREFSFVGVTGSVWGGVGWAVHGGRPHDPNDATAVWMGFATLAGAILAGSIAAVLAGTFAGRIHRSLWPEHPDEW